MPLSFAFRTVAVVATLAFLAGCLAAVANAQEAATAPQRSLVAAGSGLVAVTPKDRKDNASIAAAVKAADAKALPAAIADAKAQAAALAAAAGVTLGPLVSLANTSEFAGGPYFGPYFGVTGTFGPGKFCGKITTRRSVLGKDGKRHLGKPRTHRTCRVPSTVQRTVQLTYALG